MNHERKLRLNEPIQMTEARRTTIHYITCVTETLPIYITKASRQGPCVWVQAGTHGDEYDGIKACLDLSTELESILSTGTVILCPIANGPAYRAASAANPIDRVNLNRVFASGIQPSFSVEYGHWLSEAIASVADFFIDLHGGGHFLDVCPFGMLPATKESDPMKAIAQTLDVSYLVEIKEDQGMFINHLSKRGIHSILLESGGGHSCSGPASECHNNNVKRILMGLGMLPDSDLQAREQTPISLSKTLHLYFEKNGFLLNHAPCGTALKSGDTIATISYVETLPCTAFKSSTSCSTVCFLLGQNHSITGFVGDDVSPLGVVQNASQINIQLLHGISGEAIPVLFIEEGLDVGSAYLLHHQACIPHSHIKMIRIAF